MRAALAAGQVQIGTWINLARNPAILVLLKSADVPSTEAPLLAKLQYVDRFFPNFEDCRFRRRFVNLRGIFP